MLIETSPYLKELRREYAAKTAPERRRAADFTYSASLASQLCSRFAPDMAGGDKVQNAVCGLKRATESSKFNILKLRSSSGIFWALCVTVFTTECTEGPSFISSMNARTWRGGA